MASKKRSQIQIERDRLEIANLYLSGMTQALIAERINQDPERDYTLTQQMISYDLGVLRREWKESSLIAIDELKAKELAKVDRLEREYWDAWIRSQEDAETRATEDSDSEKGEYHKESFTFRGQVGDPRFLAGIQWCVERRCKILGIDAPTNVKHTGTGESGEIVIQYVSNIGEDDL